MMTGYGGMTVVSEMGFFPSERDFSRMMEGEIFWEPMVKDALRKLEAGVTNEREVYRVFRSEIDYLSDEYEGVQELADRVKAVVHHGAPSLVDETPTQIMTEKDAELQKVANELESKLSPHSITVKPAINPTFDEAASADAYGGDDIGPGLSDDAAMP